MTNLQKALDHITDYIKKYRDTDPNDGESLTAILQQITATLFYLEKERASYHNTFQTTINQLVLGGDSVSRAENTAHVQVPEMYLLRRVMDSAYTCCDAIRSQLSWLKMEINQSK
jgi:cysteinyl-tRNA synthetase